MKPGLYPAILIAMLMMSSQALASNFSEFYTEKMQEHAVQAASLLEEIEPGESGGIPQQQLNEYYVEACWMVYNGLLVYMHETDSIPEDLSVIADAGYVEFWPLDPLSGQPMQMSDFSEPQSGSFVMQICPDSSYSLVGSPEDHELVPLSFELSVIGNETGPQLEYEPNSGNDWAGVPENAIFQVGCFTEAAETSLKKFKEQHEGQQ